MAGMVKGPAIFLAQFAGDAAPFNSFSSICGWAASLGYKGVQIPTWDAQPDSTSTRRRSRKTYCDELAGVAKSHGLAITELSTPSARRSSSPSIPPTTTRSTPSRRRRCTAIPRRGRNGRSTR